MCNIYKQQRAYILDAYAIFRLEVDQIVYRPYKSECIIYGKFACTLKEFEFDGPDANFYDSRKYFLFVLCCKRIEKLLEMETDSLDLYSLYIINV